MEDLPRLPHPWDFPNQKDPQPVVTELGNALQALPVSDFRMGRNEEGKPTAPCTCDERYCYGDCPHCNAVVGSCA